MGGGGGGGGGGGEHCVTSQNNGCEETNHFLARDTFSGDTTVADRGQIVIQRRKR